MLLEYTAREWFRMRHGLELWQVHPSDLVRYRVCREVAEEMAGVANRPLSGLLQRLGL